MAVGRNSTRAAFGLDLNGKMLGMLKKATPFELSGDKHDHKSGFANVTMKSIANISYGDGGFSVGASMGKELQTWIQQSFDNAGTQAYRDGAFIAADFDYKEVGRQTFSQALITECSFSNLDGSSKDAIYCDAKLKCESARMTHGGGSSIGTALGTVYKDFMCANFKVDVPGLDCSTVQKVELCKLSVKTAVDAVGHVRENSLLAHTVDISDLKLTIGSGHQSKVEKAWYDAAQKWFIAGETLHENHLTIQVDFLAPNQTTVLGGITYGGCGFLKFKLADFERGEKAANFEVTFYTETALHKFDRQDKT